MRGHLVPNPALKPTGQSCALSVGLALRYAAFDAARAFLARWPLSAKNRTFDYGKKWASI